MHFNRTRVSVAVVGCGTVGGATVAVLTRDGARIAARSGVELDLAYVVEKNAAQAEKAGVDRAIVTDNLETALNDATVRIVVELVGGTGIAREIVEKSLRAGKHVVTANKALLAKYGPELFAIARENAVSLAFEASCGGGIPIVRALYDGLIANEIEAIYGIVNGTCNYILSKMITDGESYAEALADAQEIGLAEADPGLDVGGLDSAHKIAIMGALAFGQRVAFDSIPVVGIDSLDLTDVLFAQRLGYVVKLLAIAEKRGGDVSLRVEPAFIGEQHPLAWVSGPFNAVSVYGNRTGHTMYYGRGAGGSPTASAVVADIVSVATGVYERFFDRCAHWPDRAVESAILPIDDTATRFYIRTNVTDSPGTLAQIAAIFGRHGISIASVHQDEIADEAAETVVPVVVTLHTARRSSAKQAVAEIDALSTTGDRSTIIPIVDEHAECVS